MSRFVHLPRELVALLVVLTLAAPGPARSDEAAPSRNDSPPRPLLGFAVNAHHISDLPAYLNGVDAIADLGANSLIVITPWFQKRIDSDRIRHVRSRCPTDEQLITILRRGKLHGLHTILMPIVLIEKPGKKEWRGLIQPDDWDDWWESYDDFIDHFTDVANAAEVDMLSVGSELNSTEHMIDRWKHVVQRARARFDGTIMYSANWDRYEKVDLWPLVDVMSVSSYFELERDNPDAPEEALVKAWMPKQAKLLAAAAKWDKPLLISEVGYPSLPWASAHPWNYVAGDVKEADHEAQARCWRAFFAAWTDLLADAEGPVLGFCGYRWDPYHQGDEKDTGYGIVGKPAMGIIRKGFANIRRAAQSEK